MRRRRAAACDSSSASPSVSPRALRPAAGFADDVRSALRTLLKLRTFALGAIVMLALGIGVNTAVFSMASVMARVVDRFKDPDGLVFVWGMEHGWDQGLVPTEGLSVWQDQSTALEEFGFHTLTYQYLTGSGQPLRVRRWCLSPTMNAAAGQRSTMEPI